MSLPVRIFTLALDAMPQITWHLPTLNRLNGVDWRWIIVHGTADNVLDTSWCAKPEPGLSRDGTTEYLATLKGHPRITIIEKPLWHGKTEMCNAALKLINDPCIVLQMDADEVWAQREILAVLWLFDQREGADAIQVCMRYFVGHNIVTLNNNSYGNNAGEWVRAWRYWPGRRFIKHEPPTMAGFTWGSTIGRDESLSVGIRPDHYAYVFEHQVAFKERYYKYRDAVKHWKRLQAHQGPWPVRLKDFLPWVDDRAQAGLHVAN